MVPKFPILRPRRIRRGFTLIEAAIVTVIVGVGTVAMMQLMAAGSMASRTSNDLTTAQNLAKNIHELSLGLAFADPTTPTHWGAEAGETLASYDDLDDLDGKTFSPPIDARRQTIANMSDWSQSVTVESVSPDWLTLKVGNGSSRALRLTVSVSHHGQRVTSISWLAFDTSQ